MKPPGTPPIAWRVLCSLVLSAGMLVALPATVSAQGTFGTVDFCSTQRTDYDITFAGADIPGAPCPPAANGVVHTAGANPSAGRSLAVQVGGLFTDVDHTSVTNSTFPRPYEINACNNLSLSQHPEKCALHFFGKTGSNDVDLWVTLVGAPGTTPPVQSCWSLKANVWFQVDWNNEGHDTGRSVGFVTNYNSGHGLFFGLAHAGNTNSLDLLAFDLANAGKPNSGGMNSCDTGTSNCYMVASVGHQGTVPLMTNKIDEGNQQASPVIIAPEYRLQLDICTARTDAAGTGPVFVSAIGSAQPAGSTPGTCPLDNAPDQYCIKYQGFLPTNKVAAAPILPSGAAGIASLSPGGSVVNTWVTKFNFVGTSQNPD